MKISIQYWANIGEKDRTRFVGLEDGYHGDTLGAMGIGYIEGICNCEYPACDAIRNRLDLGVKSLLKGHFIARVDYDKCNGCGIFVQRCQFGAAKYEVRIDKYNIDPMRCVGCGLC